MSKKIIVANMKMNLTATEIEQYINEIKNYKDVIFCPSSLYLPFFRQHELKTGIQNISAFDMGAYTGEISAKQAKSLDVKYAIVGHSERRTIFAEDDYLINKKIKQAIGNNLGVILCIGESLEEHKNNNTYQRIEQQLTSAIMNIDEDKIANIIIAYEPIWAIGTGLVPNNNDLTNIIKYIKKIMGDNFHYTPYVLYGGSVNENNVDNLKKIKEIDGLLVGGASLFADKLIKIIHTFE